MGQDFQNIVIKFSSAQRVKKGFTMRCPSYGKLLNMSLVGDIHKVTQLAA